MIASQNNEKLTSGQYFGMISTSFQLKKSRPDPARTTKIARKLLKFNQHRPEYFEKIQNSTVASKVPSSVSVRPLSPYIHSKLRLSATHCRFKRVRRLPVSFRTQDGFLKRPTIFANFIQYLLRL